MKSVLSLAPNDAQILELQRRATEDAAEALEHKGRLARQAEAPPLELLAMFGDDATAGQGKKERNKKTTKKKKSKSKGKKRAEPPQSHPRGSPAAAMQPVEQGVCAGTSVRINIATGRGAFEVSENPND